MKKLFIIFTVLLTLTACTSNMFIASERQEGKRLFEAGFYKRSMHTLLPLATNGDPASQYAVGYMYYYGYGVAQDSEVGYFWIKRAANQNFKAAKDALKVIDQKKQAAINPVKTKLI